jgi:probable lipoprotein NlpC
MIATRAKLQTLLTIVLALGTACAGGPSSGPPPGSSFVDDSDFVEWKAGVVPVSHPRSCCSMAELNERQAALARAAVKFLGHSRVEIGGQRFTYDCSGLTRGVYFSEGIDLYDGANPSDQPNGVRLIYRYMKRHGRLHHGPTVHAGDTVFFHNTWDYNRDGKLNDLLTHVGVVERVEDDGTVVFVSRVSGGIERYRMNLRYPNIYQTHDGRILNDFIRRKSSRDSTATPYLTGQLFAGFGTLSN